MLFLRFTLEMNKAMKNMVLTSIMSFDTAKMHDIIIDNKNAVTN